MNRSDEERVVVTGLGIVSPLADKPNEFYDALIQGRSAISLWSKVDRRLYSRIGGDLTEATIDVHLKKHGEDYPLELKERARRMLRDIPSPAHAVAAAAIQAYVGAGLPNAAIRPERFGHILGGHNLTTAYSVENYKVFADEPEFTDPLYLPRRLDTQVLALNSEILGLKGPSWTVGSACASGGTVILAGLDLLRAGRADAVLVSATSEMMDQAALQSLALIGAISIQSFNDEPWRASRPFDKRREGFVPSGGAGAAILETLAGARRRGAPILAEILGGGASCDAAGGTRPVAEGQIRGMRAALDDAGLNPEDVEYINAHATSSPVGDAIEVESIKTVFGRHAYEIPINATKSMTGHALTASGMVEFVATIMQMRGGVLHPTINLEEPDPQLDLDFVPNAAREYRFERGISNSFGFGGLNATIVVGRMS